MGHFLFRALIFFLFDPPWLTQIPVVSSQTQNLLRIKLKHPITLQATAIVSFSQSRHEENLSIHLSKACLLHEI